MSTRAHPEPQVRAVDVAPGDPRVPRAARQMAARVLTGEGWQSSLQYARGNTLIGREAAPAALVETVVLRAWCGAERAVAFWITAAMVVCPVCAATLAPTESGRFRVHGPKENRCSTGGPDGMMAVVRDVEPGESTYAFGAAYVRTRVGVERLAGDAGSAWYRVGSDELSVWLRRDEGALMVPAQRAAARLRASWAATDGAVIRAEMAKRRKRAGQHG